MTRFLVILAAALAARSSSASFSMADFRALIDGQRLDSIEAVLPRLPKELRSNFALQYSGEGMQDASLEYPRAILFGEDAKFVLTFNGHPSQNMHDDLEILHFDETSKDFELFQVTFSGGKARIEKNPATCMGCHSAAPDRKPFPIWGRYPFWLGSYGSNDDHLVGFEKESFLKFQPKLKTHPRYRHLLPPEGSPLSPYIGEGVETLTFRPNSNLGVYLARLNGKHLAEQVRRTEGFEKYLLLASPSFFSCRRFLSGEQKNALGAALKADFAAAGYKRRPVPGKELYETENIAYLLGTNPYAWGQVSAGKLVLDRAGKLAVRPQKELVDPYFLDSFFMTTPNYVLGELETGFFAKFEGLRPLYRKQKVSDFITKEWVHLVRTPRDFQIRDRHDELGVPLALQQSDCSSTLKTIAEEFLK